MGTVVRPAPSAVPGGRSRPRDRRERILAAATDLVARNGYHWVSMADIGDRAGITAPAIYRHFGSKAAVLVALFDRAVDGLLVEARATVEAEADALAALHRLVERQVEFVVVDRMLAAVYYREVHNLPEGDQRRLRRNQRLYLEVWVDSLGRLRPELPVAETRAVVHCAIGAVQSTLFTSGSADLPEGRRRALLTSAALRVLGTDH